MSVYNNKLNVKEKNDVISKLSNFLKLPKAQRWICCEWFYSDIDKAIFDSENDFSICLKQSFPRLARKKLRRKEWCIIRSLIGKPRRCSDAFFHEERSMLEEKRQKIRLIQQRKVSEKELIDLKDLPQEIPVTLSIGHRVYSHISHPEEGVFLGTIAAVDLVEHTYRVVFDRPSIGSQTVHDFEIKSVQPVQTIPIKAYLQTYRPKVNYPLNTPNNFQAIMQGSITTPNKLTAAAAAFAQTNFITPINSSSAGFNNLLIEDLNTLNAKNPTMTAALIMQSNIDPMISVCSPFKITTDAAGQIDLNSQFQTPLLNASGIITNNNKSNLMQNLNTNNKIPNANSNSGILGGFPIHLLLMVTRLNKILNVKRDLIKKLSEMNTQAESIKANNLSFTKDFQMNYAIIILDLEKLNKDLGDYLVGVQRYCEEFSNDFRFKIVNNNKNDISRIKEENEDDEIQQQNTINNQDLEDNSTKNNNDIEFISLSNTDDIKDHYLEQSINLMNKLNINEKNNDATRKIDSMHLTQLITKLTSLLFQLKDFIHMYGKNKDKETSSAMLSYSLKAFNQTIAEIKQSILVSNNMSLFEDKVEVHFNHIQSTISNIDKLNAFKYEINSDFSLNDLSLRSLNNEVNPSHSDNENEIENKTRTEIMDDDDSIQKILIENNDNINDKSITSSNTCDKLSSLTFMSMKSPKKSLDE